MNELSARIALLLVLGFAGVLLGGWFATVSLIEGVLRRRLRRYDGMRMTYDRSKLESLLVGCVGVLFGVGLLGVSAAVLLRLGISILNSR